MSTETREAIADYLVDHGYIVKDNYYIMEHRGIGPADVDEWAERTEMRTETERRTPSGRWEPCGDDMVVPLADAIHDEPPEHVVDWWEQDTTYADWRIVATDDDGDTIILGRWTLPAIADLGGDFTPSALASLIGNARAMLLVAVARGDEPASAEGWGDGFVSDDDDAFWRVWIGPNGDLVERAERSVAELCVFDSCAQLFQGQTLAWEA